MTRMPDSLSILFEGRQDRWTPTPSQVPAGDAPEMRRAERPFPRDHNFKGMRFGLTYADAAGNETERVVRISSLYEMAGMFYLRAFCELRQEQRTFRIDRMNEIVDLATGEVIDDPTSYFAPLVKAAMQPDDGKVDPASDQAMAILARIGDELLVLCLIARADGHFAKAERDMIMKYALARAAEEKMLPMAGAKSLIQNWLRLQDPDPAIIEECVAKLKTRDPATLQFFWNAANAVHFADENLTNEEFKIVSLIQDAIGGKVAIDGNPPPAPPRNWSTLKKNGPKPMGNEPLSGSQKVGLICFGVGAAVAVAVGHYIFPNMTWLGYLIITFFVAAGMYAPLLQMVANEKIIDRGDWPNRKKRKPPVGKNGD